MKGEEEEEWKSVFLRERANERQEEGRKWQSNQERDPVMKCGRKGRE